MFDKIICFCYRIEASSIELSIFFTSPLGIVSLSAQVVVKQIIWLLYLVMISLGDAATILIGEYIGANKPMQAANAKNVTYAICAIMLMIDAFLLLITHPWLPYLFNIEPDALSLTRYGLLLGAVVSIVDGLSLVQTGIVKAW
jgi:MATE family multidrug resistance protein